MPLITIEEAAEHLTCSRASLYSRQFREEIGLSAVRVGRLVRFAEADVFEVIERRKEKFPTRPSGDE
jgi:excisionase family DNA binding protein